nr:putative reverse transcriptase domain-containing protein [Tanacetum cinerariifolium]
MAGRKTRSNTANDTNPPNETADEVARQLNTALPNLLNQLVQALKGNRVNQREATPSCSIKIFRAFGAKEFFKTEGAVGLLTWFESIEAVLYITKCPAESQVEFASSMLQGRDGIFKKKEIVGNKKRSNDQNKNRGRDDRNNRQRTRSNFVVNTPDQGQGQRQYAGQHPSVINPGYEIEIASGVKVVINMIVRGCRLELEGQTFIIDLIPFGHGSFDVIIRMDWLSKLGAKIVCFEKIVQIPLPNGHILEVHG